MNRPTPHRTIYLGALARLATVALMLLTLLLAMASPASASETGSVTASHGSDGHSANPLAQKKKTPTPDDEDEDKSNSDDDEDTDTSKSKTKTPEDEDAEYPDEWYDAGLISGTEYESPQFGYSVEWDDPWVLDPWYDDPDNGEGTVVTEADDTNADDLHIWVEDNGTILRFQGIANEDELTAEQYLEYWQSDEYYEGFESPAELVVADGDDERAAVIYKFEGESSDFVGYNELVLADDGETLIFLFFLAPVDSFEEGYGQAQEGVQLDGDEVFSVITESDFEDAIDDLGL